MMTTVMILMQSTRRFPFWTGVLVLWMALPAARTFSPTPHSTPTTPGGYWGSPTTTIPPQQQRQAQQRRPNHQSTSSNDGAAAENDSAGVVVIGDSHVEHHPTKLGGYSVRDSWSLLVLGDLHLEDDMSYHEQARQDCIQTVTDMSLIPSPPQPSAKVNNDSNSNDVIHASNYDDPVLSVREMVQELEQMRAGDLSAEQLRMLIARREDGDLMKSFLVSLGDLGRKDIRHEPGDAGTTRSFQDAKQYLDGFGIPYELVSGNHDLEGLDEFISDQDNLKAWMDCFHKPTPQFCREIGERTVLLGVSTTRFRDAPYSSHEVHIDEEQLDWFLNKVQSYPAAMGWKVIVFSHAPIMGSGLRVLQNVHVVNGCAWLNHCSESTRRIFIQTVQQNPQIKLWFSGHFHLSHDYEDAISMVGSCAFVQVGVVGPASSRDGRRQTRFVQGCTNRIKIYTIQHHLRDRENGRAQIRLDADMDLVTGKIHLMQDRQDVDRDDWFQAYVPREEDGCYIETADGFIADAKSLDSKVCWWHMSDGKVLGLHQGQLVEYDAETLSPLGLVVRRKELGDREVVVVENGSALVLVDETTRDMEVIHPNEDGSYWRKLQRNKRVRQEEKAREAIAKMWIEKKGSSATSR